MQAGSEYGRTVKNGACSHINIKRFMATRDTKLRLTKFTVKPLGAIVSSAFGAEELFANVRHFEVIAVEKDLHTRELVLKLAVKS